MQGLGASGAQQSKDYSFEAGHVAGAPLRVSWFLVIFFIYQLIEALQSKGLPAWVRVVQAVGNEFLLLFTVLCHEMGHGTMARCLGGEIMQVLLWPFGGICFTTRALGRDARQKLVDDLKIVGAGPATHFPMSAAWLGLLVCVTSAWGLEGLQPAWRHLVPFTQTIAPCFSNGQNIDGCIQSYAGWLVYGFLTQAIELNVMLFIFNVFFPMYPMDGAKLIVCSLQLFFNASARTAAKVLIGTSVTLSVLFIGRSLMGLRGGGMMSGVSAYLGVMCLMETWRIYTLMRDGELHTHPLFELARSDVHTMVDSPGTSQRLNISDRDDVEAPRGVRGSGTPIIEVQPFSGTGRVLRTPAEPSASSAGSVDVGRAAFLEFVEREAVVRGKSVRQLEQERHDQDQHQRNTR